MFKIRESDFQQQQTFIEEDLITKKLPSELFKNILSLLDALGIQLASKVNKFWNKAAIDVAKHREFFLIKNFTYFLYENIGKKSYPEQTQKVVDVIMTKNILESTSLNQLKFSILEFKEKISDILQQLTKQDLKRLQNNWSERVSINRESIFLSFGKIIETIKIDKKINEANAIVDKKNRWTVLSNISKKLAKGSRVEKAMSVAYTIHDSVIKHLILKKIATRLTKQGNIAKALEIASQFDSWEKEEILNDIALVLADRGDLDKAREIAFMISDEARKEDVLREIALAASVQNFLSLYDNLIQSSNF